MRIFRASMVLKPLAIFDRLDRQADLHGNLRHDGVA
tara:strand:+ start:73 stop:180 length:108 start_codon:yes stop_codon:yes gene_type:complete